MCAWIHGDGNPFSKRAGGGQHQSAEIHGFGARYSLFLLSGGFSFLCVVG